MERRGDRLPGGAGRRRHLLPRAAGLGRQGGGGGGRRGAGAGGHRGRLGGGGVVNGPRHAAEGRGGRGRGVGGGAGASGGVGTGEQDANPQKS